MRRYYKLLSSQKASAHIIFYHREKQNKKISHTSYKTTIRAEKNKQMEQL